MKFPNETQQQIFGKIGMLQSETSAYAGDMRDEVSSLLAENLKRLLEEKDTNALALAEKCKMGRSSVYDILKGRSQSPKISTVAKLADGLGVPLSEMFLTQEQVAAQAEMLRAYYLLPDQEQRRLAQVARAMRLDDQG